MKNILVFLVAVLATSCNAQESGSIDSKPANSNTKTDSINQPKEHWKVHKEFDENGNVIRYDSIYSWSSQGSLKTYDPDSLLLQIQQRMRKHLSMLQRSNHFKIGVPDSIIAQFFSDDVFLPSSVPNVSDMTDILKQMDSIQQHFFHKHPYYLIPPDHSMKKDNNPRKTEI
jgi:hypothetical protein